MKLVDIEVVNPKPFTQDRILVDGKDGDGPVPEKLVEGFFDVCGHDYTYLTLTFTHCVDDCARKDG